MFDDDEDDWHPATQRGGVSSRLDGGGGGARGAVPPPPSGRPGAGAPPPSMPQAPPRGAPQAAPPRPPARQQPGMHERPTELLPPITPDFGSAPESSGLGREPELLTHQYNRQDSDYGWDDEDYWDDEDDDYDEDDPDAELTEEERAKRKKKVWRRVRRGIYIAAAVGIIGPIITFAIMYMLVDVPTPQEVANQQSQAVTLTYSNGQPMSQIIPEDGNRKIVEADAIPQQVKRAAYAAEDATFETNAGFDVSAIMRAAWNQVTGGGGGGSTISQQYIKKATENEEYSIKRKILEVVKSFKMNNEQTKKQIITAYLNTIYFGRGANGIQAAAQAYYKKDVGQLTPSESALIAGMIQSPGKSGLESYQRERWNYVTGQMIKHGWMKPEDKGQFPKPIPSEEARKNLNRAEGPEGLIQRQVILELERNGFPEDTIHRRGLTIKTSIDPHAQKMAEKAVNDVMQGEPQNLRQSLVAVDPNTGGVLAYYGGKDLMGLDYAQSMQEPGSSFKPFDLVALLKQGKGLGETYDGTSPRVIKGAKVTNSEGENCSECTVATAMERSINTVFVDMAVNTTGIKAVAEAAHDAGIPKTIDGKPTLDTLDANMAIGGGKTQVRTIDMANAYATFANEGQRHQAHFVLEARDSAGNIAHQANTQAQPAFDPDPEKSRQIAGNVTKSLEPVLPHSELSCEDGRECAGKTGTHQYVDPNGEDVDANSKAWMVGYTPQIAAAVWMGSDANEPILEADGSNIYGRELPGEIWKQFMDTYLKGKPQVPFPEVAPIGKDAIPDTELSSSVESSSSAPPPSSSSPEPPSSSAPPPSTQPSPSIPEGEPPPTDGEPTDDPGFPFDPGNGGGGDEGG